MYVEISLVVPVYNVGKYLEHCIISILNQDYENWELILIDDGSQDESGNLCDLFVKKDSRIKVIHQKNQGQAAARNRGIEFAKGNYISFIDSDDSIKPMFLSTLLQTSKSRNCDIVACGINFVYSKMSESNSSNEIFEKTPDEALFDLFSDKYFRFEVWNKLYKREIFENLRFKEGQLHEEVYLTPRAIILANKLAYVDLPLYNYLVSREGNTNSSFNLKRLVLIDEFKSLITYLSENRKADIANIAQVCYMSHMLSLYKIAYRKNVSIEIRDKILNEIWILSKQMTDSPYRYEVSLKLIVFRIWLTLKRVSRRWRQW